MSNKFIQHKQNPNKIKSYSSKSVDQLHRKQFDFNIQCKNSQGKNQGISALSPFQSKNFIINLNNFRYRGKSCENSRPESSINQNKIDRKLDKKQKIDNSNKDSMKSSVISLSDDKKQSFDKIDRSKNIFKTDLSLLINSISTKKSIISFTSDTFVQSDKQKINSNEENNEISPKNNYNQEFNQKFNVNYLNNSKDDCESKEKLNKFKDEKLKTKSIRDIIIEKLKKKSEKPNVDVENFGFQESIKFFDPRSDAEKNKINEEYKQSQIPLTQEERRHIFYSNYQNNKQGKNTVKIPNKFKIFDSKMTVNHNQNFIKDSYNQLNSLGNLLDNTVKL